jgi:hypothetical protein
MAVNPSNVVEAIKDHITRTPVQTLAGAAAGIGILWCDPDNPWEIITIWFVPVTNYIAAQAVAGINVGIVGAATKFLNGGTLGTAAAAAGARVVLYQQPRGPLVTPLVINAGDALVATYTATAGQTGTGQFFVKVRPMLRGNMSSKR